eukprot:Amastigsp_a510160_20.p4 type:complete len:128 gc:universal Amastigsp_a510160_20:217-600(+)
MATIESAAVTTKRSASEPPTEICLQAKPPESTDHAKESRADTKTVADEANDHLYAWTSPRAADAMPTTEESSARTTSQPDAALNPERIDESVMSWKMSATTPARAAWSAKASTVTSRTARRDHEGPE